MNYRHFLIGQKEVVLKIARDLSLAGYWQKIKYDKNTNSYELITKASSEEVYALHSNYIKNEKKWMII